MPPKGAKKGKQQTKAQVERPKQVVCPACVVNAVLPKTDDSSEEGESGSEDENHVLPKKAKQWLSLMILSRMAEHGSINTDVVKNFIEREYEKEYHSTMPFLRKFTQSIGWRQG